MGLMRDVNVPLARVARCDLHLRRMRRKLERLRRDDHSDSNVLAILAVEAFYRPRARRLVEYASWLALSMLGSRSAERITVGIAQVRLSHWRDLGLLDSERFSIDNLARVLDADSNYEACHRYLSGRNLLHESDPATLTTAYTGAARPHYAAMLEQALITFAVEHPRSGCSQATGAPAS